jgi:AAA+ ATPase superfamily predicted ATPase
MNKKLKQAYGNWVEGDRFWDRESDIELMINKLDEGAHILLVAQRRMGKTSLMKEIKRQLSERYTSLFVDLQKAWSSEERTP